MRLDQMEEEGIEATSTDVWTTGPIQRYEERPDSMRDVCLDDFLAWYTPSNKKTKRGVDTCDLDVAADDEGDDNERRDAPTYKMRTLTRVLRSRCYDTEDVVNYKREMVLLYVPFTNEVVDILDRNKFLELYDRYEPIIMER